jgi:nitrilase
VIVDPTGKILAGPARHEETILYAEVDLAAVRAARRFFDPVGHYNRPDIFQLQVDTRPRPSVVPAALD